MRTLYPDGPLWTLWDYKSEPKLSKRQVGLTPYSGKEFIEAINGAGDMIERASRTIVSSIWVLAMILSVEPGMTACEPEPRFIHRQDGGHKSFNTTGNGAP